MQIVISIAAVSVVISVLVLVHEGGHYLVARLAGIGVLEFSIGFGPKLFSYKKNGTTYRINLYPLGGMVRLAGLDGGKRVAWKHNYHSKNAWIKMATVLAGPLANILFAVIVVATTLMWIGVPENISPVIKTVYPNSPAQMQGIKSKDKIISFNGQPVPVTDIKTVIQKIHASKNKSLTFTMQRNEKAYTVTVKPRYDEKQKLSYIGVTFEPIYKRMSLLSACSMAGNQIVLWIKEILSTIPVLFKDGIKQLGGPIAIAQLSGQAVSYGASMFFNFLAFISINLAVLNLLPIPALDGARIMFLLYEALTGHQVHAEWENRFHQVGFLLLLILLLFITLNDIKRLIGL